MPAASPSSSHIAPAPRIDVMNPDTYERSGTPHDQFAWLRANDPVHWHPDPSEGVPGFWAVTRHADIVQVSRRPEVFSSYERTAMFEEYEPEDVAMQQMMMLNQDPPQHTQKRSMVNRGFTPRMIKQLAGQVRDISHQLVDEVCERGEADFVADIAAPLPLYVICEMIGAPAEDRAHILDLSNQLAGFDDPELNTSMETAKAASMEIFMYAQKIAQARLAEPRDDIASKLLHPDQEGSTLTEEEFNVFLLMLIIAGNETTRTAAAGGMRALFEHPGQWRRLLDDRSLLRTAPDEMVRWVTPINQFRRTAMRDTELGGKKIKAGDKVVLCYASANRDEDVFADPYTFDVGRDPNPHIGFGGGGPHFCLGTHLARLELSLLYEVLLERMPDLELAGAPRRLRSNFVNGLKELPVRFTPTARRG